MREMSCWVLALALLGCGAQVATTSQRSAGDGPIHDPLTELAAWREPSASPPDRGLVRRPAYEPSEPPPMLRAFSPPERERIERVQPIVHSAAREHGLPPDLVNGIIWVESKFIPSARSKKGPRGLMQLMPSTARELARDLDVAYAPLDPEFNINAGTCYFARLLRHFEGNLRLALAAYNIGPAVVDGWMRDAAPLPDRSRAYVDNVFTAARTFRTRNP